MSDKQKKLETSDKKLLIGILIEMDGGLYVEVKNRCKVDYISVEALMTDIEEFAAEVTEGTTE